MWGYVVCVCGGVYVSTFRGHRTKVSHGLWSLLFWTASPSNPLIPCSACTLGLEVMNSGPHDCCKHPCPWIISQHNFCQHVQYSSVSQRCLQESLYVCDRFTHTYQNQTQTKDHQYPDGWLTLMYLTVYLQKPQSEHYPLGDLTVYQQVRTSRLELRNTWVSFIEEAVVAWTVHPQQVDWSLNYRELRMAILLSQISKESRGEVLESKWALNPVPGVLLREGVRRYLWIWKWKQQVELGSESKGYQGWLVMHQTCRLHNEGNSLSQVLERGGPDLPRSLGVRLLVLGEDSSYTFELPGVW